MDKHFVEADLQKAHQYSSKNRRDLERDNVCGCFHCLKIFNPNEIDDWLDDGDDDTAECPYYVFGNRRPLNAIESGHIFFNLEKSMIIKGIVNAYKQVCQDKQVNKFLEKCIDTANKHIGTFTTLLLEEALHSPRTFDSEITNSNVAPFSNKLMLFHLRFLFATAVSYYGTAVIYSMRADISLHCEKAILDDLLVCGRFGKILIKKIGWSNHLLQMTEKS